MDQQKLRNLVFEKTGVRIDIDDPIFALVALNEAVLAEAVERHVALLDDATADLAEQAQALQDSGSACRYTAGERPAPALLKTPTPAVGPSRQEKRIMAIAAGAALLCAMLVLIGQALFFTMPVPPAPTVVAKELTPEQAGALRDAEKMATIVQKLDQKTRNAIQAEMQKP
jgi:hypothetical protein